MLQGGRDPQTFTERTNKSTASETRSGKDARELPSGALTNINSNNNNNNKNNK